MSINEPSNYIGNVVKTVPLLILNGQTESAGIDVTGTTFKTIILPAGFEGTLVTFKISDDGITYYDYCNIDNDIVAITCSANRAYGLGAIDFYSIQFLKVVSNIAVGADRELKLIVRGL